MARNHPNKETMAFTPEIDERILKGFLSDQNSIVEELESEGFIRRAIFKRARDLGFTDQFMEQYRLGSTDVAIRQCLRCNSDFASMGPHNRLCPRCQAKA